MQREEKVVTFSRYSKYSKSFIRVVHDKVGVRNLKELTERADMN